MSKVIVWLKPDGQVWTTVPIDPPLPSESESEYLDRLAAHALIVDPTLADCVRLTDTEASDLPSRRFRASWRYDGNAVAPNVQLARQQRLTELRADRNRLLDASDVLQLRAFESGNESDRAEVSTYRQALRDLPATVSDALSAMTTAEELEAFSPEWPTL